jgi:hypothetical protein
MRQSNYMISLRQFLLLASAALVATASAQLPGAGKWAQANSVNWGTFKSGPNSRVSQQGFQELGSESEFMNYWQNATGNRAGTAPKGIDWGKQKLVAVHLGTRPTSGFSVIVQNVVKDAGGATIRAVEQTPIPGQYVVETPSNPYVIIKVDRTAGNFKINWETRQATPSIILGPGGAYIGPKDNDGAGWVDPKYQCNWGTYRQGIESDITKPQMIVMKSEYDFQCYYVNAFNGGIPPSGIDWRTEQLVAIHLGTRPTNGIAVSVRNVMKDGTYGIIRVVEETPVPGQMIRRRPTQPFVVIRVERSIQRFDMDMSVRPANSGVVISGGGW